MDRELNISAIVMAAGLSSRMGEDNKMLLKWGDKTIVEHTLSRVAGAGFKEVILVVGRDGDELSKLAEGFPTVEVKHNDEYESGLTSSIKTGVAATDKLSAGYMICLGDMCLIRSEEYADLGRHHLQRFRENNKVITLPKVNGNTGNPVVFSHFYKMQIMSHDDVNGCKAIVASHKSEVEYYETDSSHFTTDIDTWEDYFRIKEMNP